MSLLLALTGGAPPGSAAANDAVGFGDAATALVSALAGASDAIAASDAATALSVGVAAAVDSAAPSDSAVALISALAAAQDTAAFSDSALATAVMLAVGADAVSLSDATAAFQISALTAVAVDGTAFGESATALKVPSPPAQGGGRAWLRAWLQEQYTQDFEKYAAKRAAATNAAVRLAAPVQTSMRKSTTPALQSSEVSVAPESYRRAPVEARLRQYLDTRAEKPVFELPPETDLTAVRRAVEASAGLHPQEEEAILAMAVAFNL